jgi:hypothetical protein
MTLDRTILFSEVLANTTMKTIVTSELLPVPKEHPYLTQAFVGYFLCFSARSFAQ